MTTARPLRRTNPDGGLRVLKGQRLRRPSIAPWMIMVLIAIIAFLGLGFARISLDRSAFQLSELNKEIDTELALNEQLKVQVAELENPARIAPLADEMGMVIPTETNQLLVDLDAPSPLVAGVASDRANQ